MTAVLVSCGILLWRRRNETGDHSRTIQAIFSWVSASFALLFIVRTWLGTTPADGAFFDPEHTFVPILFLIAFFLYPIEVIRPVINRAKVYAFLFVPLLALFIVGMCTGITYTPIYTYSDLREHIGEFNVLFRIFTMTVILFYSFFLFLIPYDWRKSSADRKFITYYALWFCIIMLLQFAVQLFHIRWIVILHQVVWIAFFMGVAHYELNERLLIPKSVNDSEGDDPEVPEDRLWKEITLMLDNNEKWRSPNLSLVSLSEQLESNRTYVGESFKRNTGMTFVEYINRRRVEYVADMLKKNPKADVHELFNYVGYRQRSTAWRNFQKVMGMTLTDYLEGLK